jgi:glutaredoxin 3
MSDIQIYTWSNCPFFVRAKDLLKRKGLKFTEINLDGKDAEVAALRTRTGMRTIPQIFIDGQLIGGFSELAALDSNGELQKLAGQ